MAIQRCPYCKAIIDEGAEYCTNCGTKLLFPEDEFVEEEIPGEKIIDVDEDVSGKQQELSEPLQEDPPEIEYIEEGKEDTGVEDDLAEPETALDAEADSEPEAEPAAEPEPEMEPEPEEPAAEEAPIETKPAKKRKSSRKRSSRKKAKKEEPVTIIDDEMEPPVEPLDTAAEEIVEEETPIEQEDIKPEYISEDDSFVEESIKGLTDDLPDGFADKIDEAAAKVGEPLPEFKPEPPLEEETVYTEFSERDLTPQPGTPEAKEWQTPPPDGDELKEPEHREDSNVQTGDLEEIVDEAEKEKEEIDEFVASIKKERESVRDHLIPDTQDMPPWADAVQDGPLPDIPPTDEIVLQEDTSDEVALTTDDSQDMETDPVEPPEEQPAAIEEDEIGLTPGYDTQSAFPETVDQQGLPFLGKTGEGDTSELAESEPTIVDPDSGIDAKPIGFGDWIKARVFDVVFVTTLWFVALWIASQVLGNSVFLLITKSAPGTLLFLAVLLMIYFFFFLFFLGETLGNYLFSSDE